MILWQDQSQQIWTHQKTIKLHQTKKVYRGLFAKHLFITSGPRQNLGHSPQVQAAVGLIGDLA